MKCFFYSFSIVEIICFFIFYFWALLFILYCIFIWNYLTLDLRESIELSLHQNALFQCNCWNGKTYMVFYSRPLEHSRVFNSLPLENSVPYYESTVPGLGRWKLTLYVPWLKIMGTVTVTVDSKNRYVVAWKKFCRKKKKNQEYCKMLEIIIFSRNNTQ